MSAANYPDSVTANTETQAPQQRKREGPWFYRMALPALFCVSLLAFVWLPLSKSQRTMVVVGVAIVGLAYGCAARIVRRNANEAKFASTRGFLTGVLGAIAAVGILVPVVLYPPAWLSGDAVRAGVLVLVWGFVGTRSGRSDADSSGLRGARYRRPEPMATAQRPDPVQDRWRAMMRMAFSWRQPKPTGSGERTAHQVAMFFLALLPAWLIVGHRVSVVAVAAVTALGVVAWSLAWSAWVCYGRHGHS